MAQAKIVSPSEFEWVQQNVRDKLPQSLAAAQVQVMDRQEETVPRLGSEQDALEGSKAMKAHAGQ